MLFLAPNVFFLVKKISSYTTNFIYSKQSYKLQMTKLSESIIEDINEEHVGAWTEMITTSNPPIPNTPLSAYMDDSVLSKVCVAFSAEKIKRVTGFEVKHPKFTKEELSDVVDRWKEEGSWPNVEPKPE